MCIFNGLFHENNQTHTTENGAITPKHVALLINYNLLYIMCELGK